VSGNANPVTVFLKPIFVMVKLSAAISLMKEMNHAASKITNSTRLKDVDVIPEPNSPAMMDRVSN
jgi:hypothetical protein